MKDPHFAVADDSRLAKAKKILSCLEYVGGGLKDKDILEVGCGSGLISQEMARKAKSVRAIDIGEKMLIEAMNGNGIAEPSFDFAKGDAGHLPFRSGSFDIVVCNQVIEHVPGQQQLLAEAYRVLKPHGLCYVATPNKLWPMEPHTRLPFLSYLPKSVANMCTRRLRGSGDYRVTLLTHWKLRKMMSASFDTVIDITPTVVKNPGSFCLEHESPKIIRTIVERMPMPVVWSLLWFFPGWIMIGVKRQ